MIRVFPFLFILGIFLITGTSAYLSDYTQTKNEFTVGKVDIQLLEPNWNLSENLKLEPNDTVIKDPQVKNIGKNDSFVYLEVQMPVKTVMVASADGASQSKKNVELFSFTPTSNWSLIDTRTSGANRIYTYSYNHIISKNQTTTALFNSMRFVNVVEGELDTQQINVPIRAYGIQTENTGDNLDSIKEQAKAAYKKYYNQNVGQSGAATALVS